MFIMQGSTRIIYRKNEVVILLYIQNIIRATIFLYSPYHLMDGIKDVLSYKFRRLTIGQNNTVVCTKVATEMHEVLYVWEAC